MSGVQAAIQARLSLPHVAVDLFCFLQDCPIDLLRAAIEECRAANIPQAVVDEALQSRAAGLKEADRRILFEIGQDEEKRASYNSAVRMLHESIQTGNDVPAEFEELINELIVNHVL